MSDFRTSVLGNEKESDLLLRSLMIFGNAIKPCGLGRNEKTALALRLLALTCENERSDTPEGGLDVTDDELIQFIQIAVNQQNEAKGLINQPATTT